MTQPLKADTTAPYQETDDALLRRIQSATATIEVATRNKKAAEAELLQRRDAEIKALLKAKDEPFGKVDIIVGNHKLEVTTPKKVSYDQKILKQKVKEIIASGNDPDLYVETEYHISETRYKSLPDDARNWLQEARTVEQGKPSIKISEDK